MIVYYRPEALADIDEIYSYLHERSPIGAENVRRAIYASVELIGKHPLAAPATSRPEIRAKVVTRYRYKIFYSIAEDGVDILHIRHTSRAPWF